MPNFWTRLVKPFTVLAPMDDVTDYAFRELVANYLPRPDVFFTEFTNAEGLVSAGKKSVLKKFLYSDSHRPIVAQIWGINPDNLKKAAKMVFDLGFDGVDINMGCPDKKVVKKGAGAGCILDFEKTARMIAAVRSGAKKIPVSVKTRLGFNKIQTNEWISFLLKQGLDALTIHGRTAIQMSEGSANWDEIGKAVEIKNKVSPSTIIVGNGDILSYSQVLTMYDKHHVDGVMIGRGIFHDPWVFEKQIEKIQRDKKEYFDLLKKHIDIFDKTWGKTKNFSTLKKFCKMYIKGFDGASSLREKLMNAKDSKEMLLILQSFT
ncbi:MAG: tRNA-dihydrouridine synthase [Patescibacteria group bacterium]|nr:tRNA-dihydrouridine synthase [Patescibacteria group bacterium]